MISASTSVTALVGVCIIVGICLAAGGVYFGVRNSVRRLSNRLFGMTNLIEGVERIKKDVAETPKSVSGMTRLFEPQIMRDFPEFSWDEFKHKAENMLMSAFVAISSSNVDALVEASQDVRNQIANRIESNALAGEKEVYRDVKIHQTEIADYRKENGKCIIKIQSAVEYYYYRVKGDRVVDGSKEYKKQTKYNVELLYIQDSNLVEFDNAIGTNCPNCGAPVTNLGHKYCEYCGLRITTVNVKVWSLHKFYEVDYNHI